MTPAPKKAAAPVAAPSGKPDSTVTLTSSAGTKVTVSGELADKLRGSEFK
jgi:hypothetical protein